MSYKFVVFTPSYTVSSAGVIALHRLYTELSSRNENVLLYITDDVFNRDRKIVENFTDSIAIYPEITWGNPLGSFRIAREIMHIPGFLGGPKNFDIDNVLWAYSEYWNREANLNLPNDRILHIPTIEFEKFKNFGLTRNKKYYYRGKKKEKISPPKDSRDILSGDVTDQNRHDIFIERFNHAEVLYCYDNATALTTIALLCGCPVIILPDDRYSYNNIISNLLPGMGYGLDQENIARDNVNSDLIRTTLKNDEITFQHQLTNFITVMKS